MGQGPTLTGLSWGLADALAAPRPGQAGSSPCEAPACPASALGGPSYPDPCLLGERGGFQASLGPSSKRDLQEQTAVGTWPCSAVPVSR